MEFIVEDGTGNSAATSYADIAYADDYVSFYFPEDSEWIAKTEPRKQLALIISTRFVDRMLRWGGEILSVEQALAWPRKQFKDSNGRIVEAGTIPEVIKQAVVEMALESLTADIYDEGVLISSQKYGSAQESYAGVVRDGGNVAALRIRESLKRLGYGTSFASIITLERA